MATGEENFVKLQELVARARTTQDYIGDCILAAFRLGEGADHDEVDDIAYAPRQPKLKFTLIDGGRK